MKVSELRMGNFIYLMLNHEDSKVLEVTLNDFISIEKNQGWYKPIPLTEDWLLKFRFEQNSLNIFKKGILVSNEFEVFLGNIIVKLNYVHQLQNLYFALTGEELK